MHKFQQLAQRLTQLIEDGVWPAESKLPSLRSQSLQTGLSLMTVLNAYQQLEAQGLIYSKEKSGYYVCRSNAMQSTVVPIELRHDIAINSLVFDYLKATQMLAHNHLGSAFPDATLLRNLKLEKLIAWHATHHRHYEQIEHMPPGHLALRKLIASRYQMQGIAATAEDIVITAGALQALNLSLQTLTQAGDYIILQQTIFYGAWQAAEHLGLKVISIAEHPQHGIDLQAFADALARYPIKVCWLMLNSHNPLGFSVSNDTKQRIAALLLAHKVHLIEDDTYQELYYQAPKPLPMNYFLPEQQVLHCSSFSKTLGPSMRIGWVHAGKFSNKIQHLQLMSTLSVNPLLQIALADFLGSHHYEKHLKQLRQQLNRNKIVYYQILKSRLIDCSILYSHSAYFLWIILPEYIDAMRLYEKLLQHKIAVAPSQLFRPDDTAPQAIRINCSTTLNAQNQAVLDLLADTINHYLQAE